MKQIIYILTILGISLSNSYGQEPPKIPQVIPSSPEAASLGKYGAFPVGYYTGVPSINISLYELKVGEITLPISLSYHASGIRVDDIASSVGLGWSLNAGGCISVETKGRPDILPSIYGEEGSTYVRLKSLSFKDFLSSSNINTQISSQSLYDLTRPGANVDIEPDVYNYNIGNYSGQFFITENNQIKFLKNNDGLKAYFNSVDTTFSLFDKFGKRYIFKNKEITKSSTYQYSLNINPTATFVAAGLLSGSVNKFYSAWYLSQIIGENKIDTLNFIYEANVEKYATRINGTIVSYEQFKANPTGDAGIYTLNPLNHWQLPTTSPSFSRSYIEHTVWHLKEIRHNRTPIVVQIVNSNRNDLLGGKKIDELSVYYQSERVIDWVFKYDYFSSIWQKQECSDNFLVSTNPLGKRLKLMNIQKLGKTNSDKENQYQFSYYFDNASNKLPYRNCTNGFDHWGYFNAELNTLAETEDVLKSFPATNSPGFCGVIQYGICANLGGATPNYSTRIMTLGSGGVPALIEGGNRNPSSIYANALSLKSIQYPTGGKTTFLYENNQYSAICNDTQMGLCGGIRIKRIVDKSGNDSIVKEYNYDSGVVYSKPNYLYNRYDARDSYSAFYGAFDFNNFSDVSAYSYDNLIGYKKVTENIIDYKTNQNIKTINEYYSANDYSAGYYERVGLIYTYPYKQTSNLFQNANNGGITIIRPFDGLVLGKSYKSGLIKNVSQYSGSSLIREEKYDYDFITTDSVFGNRVKPYEINLFVWNKDYPYISDPRFYFFDIYFHETGKSFLKRKTEKVYDMYGANPVIKSTLYEYDTSNELLKSSTDSLGNKMIKKEFIYPTNYGYFPMYQGMVNPIELMKQTNRISNPIEEKTFVNDKLISNYITPYNYVTGTNIIKPSASFKLDIQNPINNFIALSAGDGNNAYIIDPRMSQEMTYTYYSNGNIKEMYSIETGLTTTYLWSYNGQYPVAEVKNATYSQLEGYYGANFFNNLLNAATPSSTDLNNINMIKNYFQNALVTTYTYKPLVGLTSMTDPRGVTTYYTYDTFNRLFLVRDNNNNIISKYSYGYQNSPDNGNGGYTAITGQLNTGTATYIKGSNGTGTFNVSGGTSSYSYAWALKNSSGTTLWSSTGTTPSISFPCTEEGTLTLQCTVTDKQTGNTYTSQKSFVCTGLSITIANAGSSIHTYGDIATISVTSYTGGSGSFTYNWYLKNSSGTIISSVLNSSSSTVKFRCTQVGLLTVQCVVKDNNYYGSTATSSTNIRCLKLIPPIIID